MREEDKLLLLAEIIGVDTSKYVTKYIEELRSSNVFLELCKNVHRARNVDSYKAQLLIDEFETIDFHGGKAQRIGRNVYHLLRGYVFDFCGKKFFAFGGASSHDVDDGILDPEDYESRSELKKVVKEWQKENKMFRIKGVSWWERELPTEEEMNFGKEMLAANNNQVDFIISHCCPQQVTAVFSCGLYKADRLTSYFNEIMENTKFIRWYFGHYHDDRVILGKFVMLYHSIQRVV